MPGEIKRLLDAASVDEVCQDLEQMLAELRVQGYVDRLPAQYRAISAQTPDDIERWCESLGQRSVMTSGRLDAYFILFDTARVRIEQLKSGHVEDRPTYAVHVSKAVSPADVSLRRFATLDEAASACISLFEQGYQISKVELPSGKSVVGYEVERAIKVGRSTMRLALMR